tara:strand:- start:719 stop:2062 length:1344 start_codon:yes stop_codon:yes gene_type:complete
MIKNIDKSKNLISFSLFTFFLWFSIDTSLFDYSQNNHEKYLKWLYLNMRVFAPYIFFFIILIFFVKFKSLLNTIQNFKIILLISLIYIIQCLSFYNTENNLLNIGYALSCIMYLFYLTSLKTEFKIIEKQFYLSFLIIFLILLIYGGNILKWFYLETTNLNLYGSWPHSLKTLEDFSNEVPKSSGLARSSMILLIFCSIWLLSLKKKINIFISSNLIIFCTLIIFLTQSRIVLIFYISYYIFYIIFFVIKNNISFKKKIFIIITTLFLPFLIWHLSVEFKNKYVFKKLGPDKIIEQQNLYGKLYDKPLRTIDPKTFTSNRLNDWNKIINSNQKVFFGNGAMGDRYLINQTASNYFLYLYASAGTMGLIMGIILYIFCIFVIIKYLLKNKFTTSKNENNNLICTAVMSFILLRCITETSIGIFGIDFLIFYICLFYLIFKNNLILKIR